MSGIDYRNDIPKHYVRKYGWLPACQQQARVIKNRIKKNPLRYFTFCAADAIDVFMLIREGILRMSDQTGRIEGVFFCEKDEQAFGKIAALIGSPTQGFQGEFEKIVLFEDDDDTQGRKLYSEEDEPYTEEIRKKLRYKDTQERLRNAFPFDVINLDVYGNWFPRRKGIIARLLSSMKRILEWQTEALLPTGNPCNQFTLFLTSHVEPEFTDREAIMQLANRVNENIRANEAFRSAFISRYNHEEANRLATENFAEFFCLALPKYMIYLALFGLGWTVQHGPIYLYSRDDEKRPERQYQIMHSVSVYTRIPNRNQRLDAPGVGQYVSTVTQLITDGVRWVEAVIDDPRIIGEIRDDLERIVELRDSLRNLDS